MPGYNSQRRGTGRTLTKSFVLFYVLFVLCRSVYFLCVNVYCTIAIGWQPNFILTNISYHLIFAKCVCVCVCVCARALYQRVSWENKILLTLLQSPSRNVLLKTFLLQITPNRSLSRTSYNVRKPG
jgi:hypothetical protein